MHDTYRNHIPAPPRRRPLVLLLVVILLGMLIMAGLIAWLAYQFALLSPAIAAVLRLALFLLPLAGAVEAGVIAWRRWASIELLRADRVVELTRAQVQTLPPTLTSLTYHDSSKALPLAAPAAALPAPLALPGPIDLADLDVRPSEQRILLGVDEHGPVTVSVTGMCHVALVGATGGGKSNLLRLILPQLQAIGAEATLADPHYAPIDPESGDDWRLIEQRLRFAPAVKAGEIDQLLDYMTEELERRLERRRKNERVGKPLFLAFDELPSIADVVHDAVPRIGRLLREGRKVHLLTIGASQSMLIKEVGGSSALRDQYRTAAYCGGDRKSAAAILDMPERAIDDGPLGGGVVLLRSEATKPARLVRVPLVSNEAIADLLGGSAVRSDGVPPEFPMGFRPPPKPPTGTLPEPSRNSAEPAPGAENVTSAEHARIVTLFAEGHDIAEIVRRIWPEATKGRQTQERSRQVQEALRRAMGGPA